MRVAIDVEQPRSVDRGVNLGRGQARVAEQLLERPQIDAPRQQMRREAVPERVGSQAVGEAKAPPRRRDRAPHEVRVERPAARADEQGRIAGQRPGTLTDIFVDRFADRGDDRHDPGLGALSGDSQRGSDRKRPGGQRQRLRNAQPSSVEQEQDREVAGPDPRRARRPGGVLGKAHRIFRRRGPRQGSRPFWSAGARKHRDLAALLGGVPEEGANARKLARRRSRAEPLAAALGEKGAQVGSPERSMVGRFDRPSSMPLEEVDQPMGGRDIGAHRVRRAPAVVLEMG